MKKTFLSLPLMVGSVAVMAQTAGGNAHDYQGYVKHHPAGSYTAPAPSHLPRASMHCVLPRSGRRISPVGPFPPVGRTRTI